MNFMLRQLYQLIHWEKNPGTIRLVGWVAPEPVWTSGRGKRILSLSRIDPRTRKPPSLLSSHYQLNYHGCHYHHHHHHHHHCKGIESRQGRDFRHRPRGALGPLQPSVQWVPGLFPGGKPAGAGVNHPPQSSTDVKERAEYTITSSVCLHGRFRLNFTFVDIICFLYPAFTTLTS